MCLVNGPMIHSSLYSVFIIIYLLCWNYNVTPTSGDVLAVPTSGIIMIYLVLGYPILDFARYTYFWYCQNGLRYLLLGYLIPSPRPELAAWMANVGYCAARAFWSVSAYL